MRLAGQCGGRLRACGVLEAPVMEEDHGSGGPKGKEGRVEVLPQPELPKYM